MRYSNILPYVALAVVVFLAVSAAFVCYGIYDAKNNPPKPIYAVEDYLQKNIFVSVRNSADDTLDTNFVISLDPKNVTVKGISIPSDTRVNIASSDQMFKDVLNIGDMDMLKKALGEIVPMQIDYHLIVKSDDFADYSGDYSGFIRSMFTDGLWQQENLSEYLNGVLSVANTDLTLMKIDEYAAFIDTFSEHTTEFYTVPGYYREAGERYLYFVDMKATNELVDAQISN